MSSSTTSAIRRSRKLCEARSTAARAASSQESVLVPTNSMTLYTLLAIAISSCDWFASASVVPPMGQQTCSQHCPRTSAWPLGRPPYSLGFLDFGFARPCWLCPAACLFQVLKFIGQKVHQLFDVGDCNSAGDQSEVQIIQIALHGYIQDTAIRGNRDREIIDHLCARAIQR